jgi:hypothetical protein
VDARVPHEENTKRRGPKKFILSRNLNDYESYTKAKNVCTAVTRNILALLLLWYQQEHHQERAMAKSEGHEKRKQNAGSINTHTQRRKAD